MSELNPRSSWTRKWAASAGIAVYLTVLFVGLGVHLYDHPVRASIPGYLIVWDMFCGWSGHERQVSYIAEGESGRYYDASAVPGNVITPHGNAPRRFFDYRGEYSESLVRGVLDRTEHEPIRRVFVVETHTPKLSLDGVADAASHPHRNIRAIVGHAAESVQMPSWYALQQASAFTPPIVEASAIRQASGVILQ